ncbi:MAG: helix-turn-helix domain-containing protein [Bacteroidetes bacterium]|nr:helix-turn-helix domain-containing protein [Bacteroidota bacterium]
MKGTLTMSTIERKRISILQQHRGELLTAEEAAAELEISVRQFYWIKARFVTEGDTALLHRARGRPSNFGFSPRIKQDSN